MFGSHQNISLITLIKNLVLPICPIFPSLLSRYLGITNLSKIKIIVVVMRSINLLRLTEL